VRWLTRDVPPRSEWALKEAGLHPVIAKLLAARGINSAAELDDGLAKLLPPTGEQGMKGMDAAAALLADAIAANKKLCIVADYDCDGATACAVAMRGLKLLGAQNVGYVVPNRVVDGYGLTPPIADRVKATGADVLITVDNGIASVQGVAHAQSLGLQVLVTDHHLPGDVLPQPEAMVNPNQPGCTFESKALAGVGVMFYTLLAARALMRERGVFTPATQPKLDALLPLVALGTVADVVRLDANNRRLVAQGLKRIRAGHMPPGMAALFVAASRVAAKATAFDFGFALGPRINAAGRLSDMTLGIECLTTDDTARATTLAKQLDAINRERRDVEQGMREQAELAVQELFESSDQAPAAITVFDPDFHEGVIGIVAGRIKERMHRPTFVFAPSQAEGQGHVLKGSGRSINGFHLRDALDLLAKRHPDVLIRFGGHAMAAGCTIEEDALPEFEAAFEHIASEWLDASVLQRQVVTDGSLPAEYLRPDVVDLIGEHVWGNGFEAPLFCDEATVISQRIVGEKHMALKLQHAAKPVDAMWFGHTQALPQRVKIAYRLDADEWQGVRRVRWLVEAAVAAV
jgi:single-stranded-DNA-specific exonuclease